MSTLDVLYRKSPVVMQNVMATAYGVHQRRMRFGGTYAQHGRELEEREWWSADALHQDQAARLRRVVRHAARHVPHYRDLFAACHIDAADIRDRRDLAELPLLDKETVRRDPQRFVSEAYAGELVAQTTGGTTGAPLRYFATRDAIRFNYAVYETRFRRWAGAGFGARMASLNGKAVVPGGEAPFWRHNRAFNQLYFSVYHLSEANLPRYVERMARFDPEVLVGYTSAVQVLAEFIDRTGQQGRVTPRAVLLSSETLLPERRRQIEAAFGCRVWNGYSLGELVAFTSECVNGTMHESPEYGLIELIHDCDDDHGGDGGDGGDGAEIVATGLANLGMPLIRYRTGDLVADDAKPGRCACGRELPAIGSILGRLDDYVVTPDGSRVGPAPMSLAFQTVPHLRCAQVYQDDPSSLTVRIVGEPEFSAHDEGVLRRELHARLGPAIGLRIERVDAPVLTAAGKQRLIVSPYRG
jgi:phenylacetate-CoA ligase